MRHQKVLPARLRQSPVSNKKQGERYNGKQNNCNQESVRSAPAAGGVLCKEALRYKSKISFKVRTTTANAKSVLSVLGACVKSGDEIEFVCEGPDEKEALEAMVGIVEAGLGE